MPDEPKRLFTRYWQSGCVHAFQALPWDVIYIEADKGVAEDVMYKAFLVTPDEEICGQHGSRWFDCEKNVELTVAHFAGNLKVGNGTFRIITADEIPYFLSGAWKGAKWELRS